MFRFYLNNTLVEDPINWFDFSETIERDDIIKGLLTKYDINLNFSGGGYSYLYSLYKESGFCNLVPLRVEFKCEGSNYVPILDGYIFLSDCKFNLQKCIVECPVEDNNFGARIFNNKSIDTYLNASLSKNGESITACPTYSTEFYRPSNGVPIVGLRKVYAVSDAFRYFIDFMTDGLVDYQSDFLDPTLSHTDNRQRSLAITTGAIIRNVGGGASPFVSFDTLFKEVNKKYPISFAIEKQSNGRPLFRLENDSYFFGTSSGVKLDGIVDLIQSIDTVKLFSDIGIGGTTASYNAAIHSVPDTLRMFFQNESYYFKSQCNIDNKLDLVTTFICDSNIIEELVYTNTTNASYDNNTFFVEVLYSGGVGGNQARMTQLYTSSATPVYYNSGLTNSSVSQNFNVYADLIQFISSNDIGFMATRNASFSFPEHSLPDYSYNFAGYIIPLQSAEEIMYYQDTTTPPNFNTAGNYTLLSRYTAPADGQYLFKAQERIGVTTNNTTPIGFPVKNPNIAIKFTLYIKKYDALNVLIETYSKVLGGTYGAGISGTGYKVFTTPQEFTMFGEKVFFLETGDYVETSLQFISIPHKPYNSAGIYLGAPTSGIVTVKSSTDTYFKTLSTEGNGTLVSGSSNNYNVERFEFNKSLSNSEYTTLKTDLGKSIDINHDGVSNKTVWIKKSVRKLATGEHNWEMISNLTDSQ